MNTNFITRLTLDERPAQEDYLSELPLIRWLCEGNTLEFRKPVTFLVGENGSGKSTLLEAIAVAFGFNPEGGSRNYQFSTADSHSRLHEMITSPVQSVRVTVSFCGRRAFITRLPI